MNALNKTLAEAFASVEKYKEAPQTVDELIEEIIQEADEYATNADNDVEEEIEQALDELDSYEPPTEVQEEIHAAEGFTPTPDVSIKGLDEKAVLVQVKRRMYSPYKRDEAETAAYGAGNVNKHLFEGKHNRVKKALAAYAAVYSFVKDNTVPWSTGIDMLNINHYVDFTKGLRRLISDAEKAVDDLVQNWDAEVQADLLRLRKIEASTGKTNLANAGDYPDAVEVERRFGIDVRFMPVPTTGDFRVQISDEDKASLTNQLREAEKNAATHVILQMMEPMRRAIDKLKVKIGDEGSIFRDSLIDNLVEVADRMNRVNLSDDPRVKQQILALQTMVSTYANNKDILRNSDAARAAAVTNIDALVKQMSGLV